MKYLLIIVFFCYSIYADDSKLLLKESLFSGLSIVKNNEEITVNENYLVKLSGENKELIEMANEYGNGMILGNSISIMGLLAIGASPFLAAKLDSKELFLGMLGGGVALTFYGASIQLDAKNKAYKIVYTLNNF